MRGRSDGNHGSTLGDPVIGAIAKTHGKSPAQMMLRGVCSTDAGAASAGVRASIFACDLARARRLSEMQRPNMLRE